MSSGHKKQAPEVKLQEQTDRLGFIGEIRAILFGEGNVRYNESVE